MGIMRVESFVAGQWVPPTDAARPIESAITGETIAIAGGRPDADALLTHARRGGEALTSLKNASRAIPDSVAES